MVFPKHEFTKASCKDANINKGVLVDLFNKIDEDKLNIHSMFLLHKGERVFQAYAHEKGPDVREEIFSVSKSFTSVAIGILMDLNLLHLEDYVLFFFRDEVEEFEDIYKELKLKHLLTMTVGQEKDAMFDLTPGSDPIKEFFKQKIIYQPGEVFMYNNYASFMLSIIVTKVTGKSLNDFLDEYLYDKIGIEKPEWETFKEYNMGAYGLRLAAPDLAKFGLLLLNDGKWENEQVVSKAYLDLATTKRVDTSNWNVDYDKFGYGYQFWINSFEDFRMEGAYQQYVIINKKYDIVFVIQAYEERPLINLFEEYILKAFSEGWKYCDYSLRDYTRKFHIASKPLIEEENEKLIGK